MWISLILGISLAVVTVFVVMEAVVTGEEVVIHNKSEDKIAIAYVSLHYNHSVV